MIGWWGEVVIGNLPLCCRIYLSSLFRRWSIFDQPKSPHAKIITFITYNNQAEEALNLYTTVFKDSKIVSINRSGKIGLEEKGKVVTATMEIIGQTFYLLNSVPYFNFSQGISSFVNCETQEEVNDLWEKLSENGEQQQCSWLKDKFGVSWQTVPIALGRLLHSSNRNG